MKREAIDTRTLVRTETTHLCLDSQFNLPGLIIPIGINIYDVPGDKPSRRDVGDLSFIIEAVAIARTNCLLVRLDPINTLKVSFAVAKLVP
jgi:hypothetical protein